MQAEGVDDECRAIITSFYHCKRGQVRRDGYGGRTCGGALTVAAAAAGPADALPGKQAHMTGRRGREGRASSRLRRWWEGMQRPTSASCTWLVPDDHTDHIEVPTHSEAARAIIISTVMMAAVPAPEPVSGSKRKAEGEDVASPASKPRPPGDGAGQFVPPGAGDAVEVQWMVDTGQGPMAVWWPAAVAVPTTGKTEDKE